MNQVLPPSLSFKWVDHVAPTTATFKQIANDLKIPLKVVSNCLNQDHLPHVESYGANHFVVMRVPEPNLPIEADTIQEITTKIAFFISPFGVVSLHRQSLALIEKVKGFFYVNDAPLQTTSYLLSLFSMEVGSAVQIELNDLEKKCQVFEQNIFMMKRSRSILKEGYYIKRKASAYRRIIKASIEVSQKLSIKIGCSEQLLQESQDMLSRCLYFAEDIYENVQSLLNLHMAIQSQKINEASYKTNETVRVLTILTLFFLPLNFITGVFGMNFEHMPWLKAENGYIYAIGLMSLLVASLCVHSFRQGWITKEDTRK